MNPLDELREKYWINVYHSDKPNSPICNLVLVDKEKEGYGYVGNLDTFQPTAHDTAKQNAYVEDGLDDQVLFN